MSLVWLVGVLLVTSFLSIITTATMKSSDDASFTIVNLIVVSRWYVNFLVHATVRALRVQNRFCQEGGLKLDPVRTKSPRGKTFRVRPDL